MIAGFIQTMSILCSAAVLFICLAFLVPSSFTQSFDCAKATHKAEKIICADDGLKALDVSMAALYKEAMAKASATGRKELKTEQIGWLKGRNECTQLPGPKDCIDDHYKQRIGRLTPMAAGSSQAPSGTKRVTFACSGRGNIVASFMGTDKVRLELGDAVLTLPHVKSGSGARYASKEATFWNKGDEAMFDYRGKSYNCKESR